nr:hypothetical protein [uncultured Flavobacterium sp.]
MYTREYTENVGGKSTFTAKGGTTYGNKPKTAKPLEITNLYVKVRLNDNYNGEFGFDWIDVDPETKEIEKIQGVPFSEVEYFYKKDPANPDLGDIVATSTDPIGARHAIQDHYNFNPVSKHIDIPFALIKCDQEITLSAEIILWQGEIKDDVITITGDEFYEFEIIGGEKEGKTAKIKLTKAGKIDFKVKCLGEGAEKTYEFKHSSSNRSPIAVGGITMMENNELKLKFRVIALVSSDGNPNEKAKALFKKFNGAGIKDYLNKNSLNQAGYQVEIENEQMFKDLETIDVDDYLYAFNKEDWTSKNYYKIEQRERVKIDANDFGVKKADGTWEMEKYDAETIFEDIEADSGKKDKQNNPIMITKSVDFITIEEYEKKLKIKKKEYFGGIIILADGQCSKSGVGAFSRTDPFNHYCLTVYSINILDKPTYAHEIAHMLGLNHTFYLGDEGLKKKWDKLRSLKNDINEIKIKTGLFEISETTTKKSLIIKALKNANLDFQKDYEKRNTDYAKASKSNGTFSWEKMPVSKKVFLENSIAVITNLNNKIKSNTQAEKEFSLTKDQVYLDYKKKDSSVYYLLKDDLVSLKIDFLQFYSDFLSKNYLMYKKGSTQNMLDYDNTKKRFQSHQIKVMRNDYTNY